MRRALSMAIDRQVVTTITNGGEVPANFFLRPDMAAAPRAEDYPDSAIYSDPEGAKAELQMYFDETGMTLDTMPEIILMHNTSTRHATIAQAIQQMWKDTLGIEVQIASQDSNVYNETLRRDAPAVFRKGWCWDYPDSASFLTDVFRYVGPDSNNNTNWANDEYNALVDQAAVLFDNDARRELYAQAEYLLVNKDAAMAPIYYYTVQQLTKPYVMRSYAIDKLERLNKWDIEQ
jgi:oligopeptide transport system substrate-binding protein